MFSRIFMKHSEAGNKDLRTIQTGTSMASTVDQPSPEKRERSDSEVSLFRLYLLRAVYLFGVVRGVFFILPPLIHPTGSGMMASVLGGLWVFAIFGIRYPLQILPIFLFEFIWKTIWVLDFKLPQWINGGGAPQSSADLISYGVFLTLLGLIIPWGYVYHHYIKKPGDRWR
jgi:hypothetical protein